MINYYSVPTTGRGLTFMGRRAGNMRKNTVRLALLAGALLLLSGCFSRTVDELYCLPKMAQDYVALDTQVNSVRESLSAEYASPRTGTNTAPVQLQDLDGDGSAESAVTFFRTGTGEHPLRICIFRQNADETYSVAHTIEGDGLAIHSIGYVDLDGDKTKELVVSWQMGTQQYILTPYQLTGTGPIELASISYTQGYVLCDLDRNNRQELMVFRLDEATPENGWAEHYVYADGQVVLSSSAPMSDRAGKDASIRTGNLKDGLSAVYVSSRSGDASVTDVFALREEKLVNVTLNRYTGVSTQTLRYVDISPTDINGDGILELPQPVAVQEYQPSQTASNFWVIRWRQFDINGRSQVVQTTYHNFSDGWYLVIPESWVERITISRDDSRTNLGERSVVFYYWTGDEEVAPREFLRIYRLDGENRELRAKRGNRFILQTTSQSIYAAELTRIDWDSGATQENLPERFSLSRTEWSNQ